MLKKNITYLLILTAFWGFSCSAKKLVSNNNIDVLLLEQTIEKPYCYFNEIRVISENKNFQKNIQKLSENKIENPINNDSLLIYKVFKNDITRKNLKNNDSLILFNRYKFKVHSKETKNKVFLKFKKCIFFKDSLKFKNTFTHLKTIDWLEEALMIKNSYYEYKDYIIIVDYVKNNLNTCSTLSSKNFMIEQIRIYNKQEYFKMADKSNSVLYSLKRND